MKKSLRKIDNQEKNMILEMHKNRGYRTIVEDEDDLLKLLDEPMGFEDETEDDLELGMTDVETNKTPEDKVKKFWSKDDMGDTEEMGTLDIMNDYEDDELFEDEDGIKDPSISDEDFFDIYNKNEMTENEKTKEKEKEKTKEKEKDKKRKNPFRDPNPGTEEDPRGKSKIKESKTTNKKIVRLTEGELIKLIKRAIQNQ